MMITTVSLHGTMVWNLFQGVVTTTVQDEFGAVLDRHQERVTVAVEELPGVDELQSAALEAAASAVTGAAREQRGREPHPGH